MRVRTTLISENKDRCLDCCWGLYWFGQVVVVDSPQVVPLTSLEILKLISSFYIRITGVVQWQDVWTVYKRVWVGFSKNAPINNVQLHCEKNYSQIVTWGLPVLGSGSMVTKTILPALLSAQLESSLPSSDIEASLLGLPKPHGLQLFIFLRLLKA